jgi:NADPH-dependent 2,4-dienoyl-CoA reductase/sulfur reductase-like enzyme
MKFVIIGGDAAGMSAASRAKRRRPDMEVTVFEKTGDVSYSACGMPYNIADPKRPMDDLVVRSASVFRDKLGIQLMTGHEITGIDSASRTVYGKDLAGNAFEKDYDKLLIATGARPVQLDLEGVDLPGVVVLKNLSDGRRMKDILKTGRVKKAVIIGMGYIALEMCEALRCRHIEVEMVKRRERFIPWMNLEMAQVVLNEIEANAVRAWPGQEIVRIEHAGGGLRVVCKDRFFDGDIVLMAVGVAPNSGIASAAGLELSIRQSIAVSRTLETSKENIYASGDCADAYHVVTGKRTWVPLALRANRAGWAAADNICGDHTRLDGVAGTAVFKVFDLQVARTGLTDREASQFGFAPASVSIQSRSRAHAHPGSKDIWVEMVGDKISGRLLGTVMVGKEGVAHRINAAAVALHSHMTVESFAQTDLAYAPPFGPVWDPMLTAAKQLLKLL